MSYIYVLSNPGMQGIVKIGRTDDLEQRLKALFNTSVPAPFKLEYSILCRNTPYIEKEIHKALVEHKFDSREFFTISVKEAIRTVKTVIALQLSSFKSTVDLIKTDDSMEHHLNLIIDDRVYDILKSLTESTGEQIVEYMKGLKIKKKMRKMKQLEDEIKDE
jgi:hypothetical protein